MGTKRLNKNGHFTEIVLHIQVLDGVFYRAEPMLDYSLCGLGSVAKYRIGFIVVRWNERQMTTCV